MKKVIALIVVFAAALTVSASAPAQTGNAQLDGNSHPNVGALLAKRKDGSLAIVCSGTLVTPRVFLTAGHCADYLMSSLGQLDAYVTFDPNFGTDPNHDIFSTPYHGTLYENPAWKPPYHHDTALVLLDAPVQGITPARLAPRHFLDGLKAAHALDDLLYTNVGYGTSEKVAIHGSGPAFPFDGLRKWTVSAYHALDQSFIHLNQNLNQGWSGTGYGDSGGPTFVDVGNGPVQISVVSAGDVPLYSTSVNTRIDTDDARDFLDPFLALS
jgi:hypothetical protein